MMRTETLTWAQGWLVDWEGRRAGVVKGGGGVLQLREQEGLVRRWRRWKDEDFH